MKFYITTPIYYVNDKPHLGHAYTTIAADIVARFYRLFNYKVFFLTGTDEHGKKIYEVAKKHDKSPQTFVDEIATEFQKTWKYLNISNDFFIRTTMRQHKEVVKNLILKMYENRDIYKGYYKGWYCTPCESYFTTRQLKDKACPQCGRNVEWIKQEAYFFKLSKYQDALLHFYKRNPGFIQPQKRRAEIINRVKEGLKDLSITRIDIPWGIRFPIDKRHIIYVWVDALINYLSGIGYGSKKFETFWPADIHFIGKEITWFHCVIWPAILMSLRLPLPKKIFSHGWLTINGEKMSKSLGNVIDPNYLVEKYSVDAFRYYLFSGISFGDDGDFSEKDLIAKYNNELIDNFGNLFYRVTSFITKNYNTVPMHGNLDKEDNKLLAQVNRSASKVKSLILEIKIKEALEEIMHLSSCINKYFQKKKPWEDKEKAKTTCYISINAIKTLVTLLYPFIPNTAEKCIKALNTTIPKWDNITSFSIKPGHKISSIIPFPKILLEEKKPDIRVATITNVINHPDAEKLYILEIDLGNEKRQIVAGLKNIYKKQELLGKQILVIINLKPRTIRGVTSYGMLLACDNGILVVPEKYVNNGTNVANFKCKEIISIKDFEKYSFYIKDNKLLCNGKEMKVKGIKIIPERNVPNDIVVR